MIAAILPGVVAEIGESDCEELGDGFLAQPVNALTSLAYVFVGAMIVAAAVRNGQQRAQSVVYAACLAAIGLGSVAFHGPQPGGSRLLHDLPILVTAVFIVAHDLRLLLPRSRRPVAAFAGAATVVVVASAVQIDIAAIATGVVLGGAAVAEWVIYRRRLRQSNGEGQRRAYALIIVVALVAGCAWLLGRTDGPICDPGSLLQFHGLWHVVSAALFGLWWWLAFPHRVEPEQPDAAAAASPTSGSRRA